jgi:hypothetical protein
MKSRYRSILLIIFMTCMFLAAGCTGFHVGLLVVPTASGDKTIERKPVKDQKGKYVYDFIDKNGKIKEANNLLEAERQLFEEYGYAKEIVIETGAGPKKIRPVFKPFSTFTQYERHFQREGDIISQHKGERGVWHFQVENEKGQFEGGFSGQRGSNSFFLAREQLYQIHGKPSCFPSDTLVVMENGTKPISKVQVGDQIMSLDEEGDLKLTTVVRTYETDNNYYYFINKKIKVTGLHRFLTSNGWKRAYELNIGDQIRTSRKDVFEEVFSKERIVTNQDIKVYNLQVSHSKNFIISPDGHSAYVVHNTGGNGGNGGSTPDMLK